MKKKQKEPYLSHLLAQPTRGGSPLSSSSSCQKAEEKEGTTPLATSCSRGASSCLHHASARGRPPPPVILSSPWTIPSSLLYPLLISPPLPVCPSSSQARSRPPLASLKSSTPPPRRVASLHQLLRAPEPIVAVSSSGHRISPPLNRLPQSPSNLADARNGTPVSR